MSRLVVTPNIHHVVMLENDLEFRRACESAALSLPDGWPVALAARFAGAGDQERVTGADLLPAICEVAALEGLRVAFVGGQPGAAGLCAERLRQRLPSLQVAFVDPAPPGFDSSPDRCRELLNNLAASRPNILFIGVGAPRQEIFAARYAPRANVVVAVGAAIDFAAGLRTRAPKVVQRLRLEWLFRLAMEPTRLWRRYANAAPAFARIVLADGRRRYRRPS
jgi:N-acetylglucosaminyldiphosphoundecaprenol N-acetyl-beta-D-mannosaminyltransferase